MAWTSERGAWACCLLFIGQLFIGPTSGWGGGGGVHAHQPKIYTFQKVAEYPHDHMAFTQGLEYGRVCNDTAEQCQDVFWESTGLHGHSSVRQVAVTTGKVLMQQDMQASHFGEGLTRLNDTIYQIVWQSGQGFKYSVKDNLKPLGTFDTGLGDGWGLTNDGVNLIATESSHRLSWIDPLTFKIVRQLEVTDGGRKLPWLNELEYIDGEVWANVWQTECIARINLASGHVTHWILFQGLRDELLSRMSTNRQVLDVLNGIAWDSQGKRLFITGKRWPAIFEVVPKEFPPGKQPSLAHVRKLCHPHHAG